MDEAACRSAAPALQRLRGRIDYAERGGAPLLGINGICIIGHGRSNAYAVTNACRAAERAIQHNIIETRFASASAICPRLRRFDRTEPDVSRTFTGVSTIR